MSDPQAPRPTYDPNELRRCIALCFSPKDLRSLAESLGATDLGSWERGIQDAAREVVRHFERLGTLDQLVAKLAEARPLMEWPAPLPNAASAPVAAPAETNPSSFAPPTIPGPETNPSPPSPPASIPADETNPSPFAPATMPAAGVAAKLAAPKPATPEPVIRDPFAPAFPGTVAPPSQANSKRLEGRSFTLMLAAGMALVAIITIGILFAARSGKSPEPTATEAVTGRPLRPYGPARMAADAMKRSLESLARGCDLQLAPGAEAGVWLFPAAYEQCGSRLGIAFPPPGTRTDKPRPSDRPSDSPSDATADPQDAPPSTAAPNTPRQTNPGRDVAPRPGPAPGPAPDKAVPSNACIDRCAATKRQCNRACGAEPTSSSEYDRWQGCQTACLSAESKCKLACQ